MSRSLARAKPKTESKVLLTLSKKRKSEDSVEETLSKRQKLAPAIQADKESKESKPQASVARELKEAWSPARCIGVFVTHVKHQCQDKLSYLTDHFGLTDEFMEYLCQTTRALTGDYVTDDLVWKAQPRIRLSAPSTPQRYSFRVDREFSWTKPCKPPISARLVFRKDLPAIEERYMPRDPFVALLEELLSDAKVSRERWHGGSYEQFIFAMISEAELIRIPSWGRAIHNFGLIAEELTNQRIFDVAKN